MDKKQVRLPKDGLIEPEEMQVRAVPDDVEGHGLPITAPPSLGMGHGGEIVATDDDDDVEGHARGIR